MLHHGSNCSLARAMDGCIMRRGISLAHANQLPLPRFQSASGHEFTRKQRYSKYPTFTFTFTFNRTHARTDGQPENILSPPDRSVGGGSIIKCCTTVLVMGDGAVDGAYKFM